MSNRDSFAYAVNRVKSGNFGRHTFANSGNPDETAPYEDFHCLLG